MLEELKVLRKKKKKYGNGGGMNPGSYGMLSDIMTAGNKNLPWVKRRFNTNAPVINNKNGSVSTHKLRFEHDGNTPVVFPTIVQQGDSLLEMTPEAAFGYAKENNTFMRFPEGMEDFANYYSKDGLIDHGGKTEYKYGGTMRKKRKYKDGGDIQTLPIRKASRMSYSPETQLGFLLPERRLAGRTPSVPPIKTRMAKQGMTEYEYNQLFLDGARGFQPDYFESQRKYGYGGKMKYGDGGPMDDIPMGLTEEDFGSMASYSPPTYEDWAAENNYSTNKPTSRTAPDNYDYSFGTVPGTQLGPMDKASDKALENVGGKTGGFNAAQAGRYASALAGPLGQMAAAGQYNFPNMDIDYTPIVPENIDFSRERSQIQEDTRTFDRNIMANTSSTPIAAAMMTARRGQAGRERAQLGQNAANMNAQMQFQADATNQRSALQVDAMNANNRKERAIFENERSQKYVDSLQQLSQNFGVISRENKLDARDKARFRFQFGASSPETQQWIIYNSLEGSSDSDIKEMADITGYTEGRLRAMHRYVAENLGPEEAAKRASLANQKFDTEYWENFNK